jgi:peptide/nickel transport system substrate-binding protein
MIEAIDSLNPFIGVNDNAYIFYGLVYDYLIAVDEDMNPEPNLALSWSVVADQLPYGSVWQYDLTPNAYWHDGEPMDADDVNFTINFQVGLNYNDMWAYQPYTYLIDHAQKKGNYTVWIYFKDTAGNPAPCPFGDKIMMPIVPEHIWGGMSPDNASFQFENPWPIGTGPFKCTANTASEFNGRSALVLLKNENYHSKADFNREVQFDRLILRFYLEPAAMLTQMQTGAIDVALFNAPNYNNLMDYITEHPSAPIGTHAGLTCTSYSIDIEVNMNEGSSGVNPLRLDPEVRKAMAHAIDKEYIKDHIYRGYAEIGATILSPIYGDLYWEPGPDEDYEFDLEHANQTLEAAGYSWNTEHTVRMSPSDSPYKPDYPLSFNIVIETGLVEDKDTADLLKYDWAKIGIELESVSYETGEWNTIIYGYSYPYDLTISYWSGDPDPNYLMFVQTSYAIGGWSENAYASPEYDENYTRSVETIEVEDRTPYIINCQKLMYQDAAFMVTVYPYGCAAWRTDHFTGWGDWEAHPGRSLSNFWTANPLYFDLVPTGSHNIDLTMAYIGIGAGIAIVVAIVVFFRFRPPKEEDVKLP